ncbi:hypothetical protein FE810_14720 [Thalassotalea litorea]|uniref:Uncharacterized protein n=1 Tax=Thalassotalea litorea TaxID=2020715 RepID=A0A5R9IJM4_9GAMM|nr:hypothetical protein [Thalassotalea litorea]TLU61487.1 hypothetical protein FE810_14720 [Thalassotalea litorea]
MKYSHLLSTVLFFLISFPCLAYLDPGTGSIIVQGIIASIALGLATIKMWWHKLASVFRKSDPDSANELASKESEKEDHSQH